MAMVFQVFFSHRMGALVERLVEQIDQTPVDPLKARLILVPNVAMKQWLFLEIAKRKGIAMGLRVLSIEQLDPIAPNPVEMFCLIYRALAKSSDPDLCVYLDGKKKRLFDLAQQLAGLFYSYGQFGKVLFEGEPMHWQQAILHKLFVEGPHRLPVQREIEVAEPVICFGIDFLPPVYWKSLFRAPALSIYLFSPCMEFWEDVCSDRERKSLQRHWERRGAAKASRDALDTYLRQVPGILANWGKIGRETLKILDPFDLQVEEAYPPLEPSSLLKQVQFDLLHFQKPCKRAADDSLKIFLTGSSLLSEIEVLRDEILKLDVPYCDISVLAPDIQPYVPLIEFVFSDGIPYRISGVDLSSQSAFQQGLMRLLRLASGRWEAEEVLSLFETPAFYRKQRWDIGTLEQFRIWISASGIRWGSDGAHREKVLKDFLGEHRYSDCGSWEKGLDRLLNDLVYFSPMPVHADRFEELLRVIFALNDLSFHEEKTLSAWADCLEAAVQEFLLIDPADEADVVAERAFRGVLRDLQMSREEGTFPLEVIQHLLFRPCLGQLHASHLHAVRFSSLEEGALLPAKALFLIGMDEEHFPHISAPSSLDLLKGQVPSTADRDRYLFLRALFSAEEFLRISYGHLSADEGKPVAPSLLVQELIGAVEMQPIICLSPLKQSKRQNLIWPRKTPSPLPEGEMTLSLSDLRRLARHPWKFFLQKAYGIHLDETGKKSFALQKGQWLRAALGKPLEDVLVHAEFPPGPLGEALRLEVMEKADAQRAQLEQWQLTPFSLIFRESCTEPRWEGPHYVAPPIPLHWERLTVRLVGEISQATLQGLVCSQEDSLPGLLKVWPEALALALHTKTSQVWMLRTGKIKSLQEVQRHLKSFVAYYFCSLVAPSPLLPEWADALLRKERPEWEKKMQKRDPIAEWVCARAQIPEAEEIWSEWVPDLREIFAGLIQLYPTRGKSHAAV